jgi:hypothetical protein
MANSLFTYPSIVSGLEGNQIFTNPEKESKFNGMCAFFLLENSIDVEFQTENDKVIKNVKATQIQRITQETPNRDSIIKTGRVACVIFKDNVIQTLTVHPHWYDKIINEQATELVMEINEKIALIQSPVRLVKMTSQSYQTMLAQFKLV